MKIKKVKEEVWVFLRGACYQQEECSRLWGVRMLSRADL